ncbi:MAG: efflux RND transporter periplasmic adaptor subunit [Nitrospiria bacterium]
MKKILGYAGGILLVVLIGLSYSVEKIKGENGRGVASSMENMPMAGIKQGTEMGMPPVQVSPEKRQMIGVKTGKVERRSLKTLLHASGTVDYNEKKITRVHLRVSGWVKALYVNSTGQRVEKGAPLFRLYSPDLFSTKQEYLLAKKTFEQVKDSPMNHVREGVASQIESARARLLLWNVDDRQIKQMDQGEAVEPETNFYSPADGYVIKKSVSKGDYVTPEMELYEIADLSTVWVYADIYESDMASLKQDQPVTISFTAYPGKTFFGKLVYIFPNLNPETRTVKARIELPNPGFLLKPGMYGDVEIQVKAPSRLVVPSDAVLDSGLHQMVFLDRGNGRFEPRQIKMGQRYDNEIEVLEGVKEGEPIVTSATFLIDSESKIMSAASMMGMLGMGGIRMEQASMGKMEMKGVEMAGMDMKDMDMSGMEMKEASPRSKKAGQIILSLGFTQEPPHVGENKVSVKVTDHKNQIIRDAEVTFAYTMTMPGMMVDEAKGSFVKEAYEGTVKFAMAGEWKIDVLIKRKDQHDVKESFILQVK